MQNSTVRYVALGDCVTLGAPFQQQNAYPERVAQVMEWQVTNYGHTMSTTREGLEYFKKLDVQNADILSIQYGIVDSWQTFNGAPFVLYYPDNKWRKFLRKIVKKIKKYGRKLNFHGLFGTRNVVPVEEYIRNIQYMIDHSQAKYVLLPEIYPNQDLNREPRILAYNQALAKLHDGKRVFVIKQFDLLKPHLNTDYYDDSTHLSGTGHQAVAHNILAELKKYGIQ
jgi:lysophospholipase L1-like esterase